MATIKDVAQLAGVSVSTVSKYINGGTVRKEKREPIRSAIAQLDFRVNPIARSLKVRRSHSIGVLLPYLSAPFFSSVFLASDKVLRERGYHCMISCYNADHGLERDYLNYLIGTGVDGLIYVPENLTAEEFQEIAAHRDVPVVQVDRMIPGVDADAVLVENKKSSCAAVSRLIEKGHKRIALVGGPSSVQTAKERLAGYLQALELYNIHYDDALVFCGELSFTFGHQSFLELMDTGTPPTAVFSTNHDITMGIITAARERGLRIPEDVAVFGYDCVDICAVMTPPLPVVYQPEQEIGRTAAAYLIERLDGYTGPSRQTRLPCEMIL